MSDAVARVRLRRLVPLIAMVIAIVPVVGATHAGAQAATSSLEAVHRVDRWLVTRFREVQLLPDSARDAVRSARTMASGAPLPRVESVRDGTLRDTVFAVQFGMHPGAAAVRVGSEVRLTSPSGAITGIRAQVVARRPFRAPRQPGTDTSAAGGWRYGWAYLALIRPSRPAAVYQGWLLYAAPDSTTRRKGR